MVCSVVVKILWRPLSNVVFWSSAKQPKVSLLLLPSGSMLGRPILYARSLEESVLNLMCHYVVLCVLHLNLSACLVIFNK